MTIRKLIMLTSAMVLLIMIGFCTKPKSESNDEQGEGEVHQVDAEGMESGGHDHGQTFAEPGETGEHEESGEELVVHMSDENIIKFGIETEIAGPGEFDLRRTVPGEIVLNAERLAHIVPRVPGVVTGVESRLGDRVVSGQVMASLESRELADAKASYLASIERFELAESISHREERLWKEKISSEQEYLDARKALAEAKIALRSAEQKLRALGFSREHLDRLHSESAEMFTVFDIRAPFDGTIIEKHIVIGEAVTAEEDVFVVADLGTVWVDFAIQQADIGIIEQGQKVSIGSRSGTDTAYGEISYIDPVIDERTRTALARAVLDNSSGKLRPGAFVNGEIVIAGHIAEVMVAREILLSINDRLCVFVKDEHGFEMRPVQTGYSNDGFVEILGGLSPGESVVTKNNFRLKAELEKGENGVLTCQDHAH
ncbi:MAG: efflux RND transporter periplasmic adaptor subunit [Candidatus Krumholzibacteriota bacterium]|nr:efflux RND transporter periplasmic adaptor subunit [Candidatus Krumholzibacteriota bacterium]